MRSSFRGFRNLCAAEGTEAHRVRVSSMAHRRESAALGRSRDTAFAIGMDRPRGKCLNVLRDGWECNGKSVLFGIPESQNSDAKRRERCDGWNAQPHLLLRRKTKNPHFSRQVRARNGAPSVVQLL